LQRILAQIQGTEMATPTVVGKVEWGRIQVSARDQATGGLAAPPVASYLLNHWTRFIGELNQIFLPVNA